MEKRFTKILIANRGEIALRIIRTAKQLGIWCVGIYSTGEENSSHVRAADEAYCLGDGTLDETYLNSSKIISLAIRSGAQAIHPGYGFLSENAEFAEFCEKNSIVFIGPSSKVLAQMGNKIIAKLIAQKAKVPVLSSSKIEFENIENLASQLKYPVLIKASYGGGGKGMQIADNSTEFINKAISASRSAQRYFGNGEVYVEEYLEEARHIEVQVLSDKYGNTIHLYERDCTIQRNHQKIIEEAPAVALSNQLRSEIHNAALAICAEVEYENAGTIEFLVDKKGRFFFLEMNPRIQVEHTVTEEITGVDIVKEQLQIAAGNPLSIQQSDVKVNGHSIQARIYAEDPLTNFTPSSKPVLFYSFPNNVRLETDLSKAVISTTQFDPLLCKLIVNGVDREHALSKMQKALDETFIVGCKTNSSYLKQLFSSDKFIENRISTNFCAQEQLEFTRQIITNRESIDDQFLWAISIAILFGEKLPDSSSIFNELGFWRIQSTVELKLDDQLERIQFKQTGNSYILSTEELAWDVVVRFKNDHEISVVINDLERTFFYHKYSDSSLYIGYKSFVYKIESTEHLSSYPENVFEGEHVESESGNLVKSHLHGKIVAVNIKSDQTIAKGDVLIVIESMKSENVILSPKKAKVKKITVEVGAQVTDQMPLIYLEDI